MEGLVKQLAAERSDPHAEAHGKDEPGSGKPVMEGVHSVHFGTSDWHAVMEEVPLSPPTHLSPLTCMLSRLT